VAGGYWVLAEVMIHWYATSSEAQEGAWSMLIDRYTFQASIQDKKEVIFRGFVVGQIDKSSLPEANCTVTDLCD